MKHFFACACFAPKVVEDTNIETKTTPAGVEPTEHRGTSWLQRCRAKLQRPKTDVSTPTRSIMRVRVRERFPAIAIEVPHHGLSPHRYLPSLSRSFAKLTLHSTKTNLPPHGLPVFPVQSPHPKPRPWPLPASTPHATLSVTCPPTMSTTPPLPMQ